MEVVVLGRDAEGDGCAEGLTYEEDAGGVDVCGFEDPI